MPRESRSYRKRSRSRSTDRKDDKKSSRRSRSRDRRYRKRSRSRDRRSRSRDRRSRSRERKRSRSRERRRSRDRRRSRSSDRKDRSKKRSRSRSRDRDRKSTKPLVIEGAISSEPGELNSESEKAKLEDEMQKRRERIEKWRKEKNKGKSDNSMVIMPASKSWNLEEDDDEEDEENNGEGVLSGSDDDPLDAFMKDLEGDEKAGPSGAASPKNGGEEQMVGKTTIITAVVAKKSADKEERVKGERMENDADHMEYSSEEEEEDLETTLANSLKGKKKELFVVDHEKIYYRPFKKSFYVEVPQIKNMSPEEVEEMRSEMDDIKVKGKNCPRPILTWAQAGVTLKLLETLKKHGYEKPTPIQMQAIPAIMSGRDLIGIAKTGSGKTVAFLLPMLRHVLDQEPIEEGDGPLGIILTPTRELAMQIFKECKKFAKPLGLTTVCVYGGTGVSEQIAELKRGCEIVVCTPGRMIDMLAANNGRVTNLRRITYIVLDEADRMFDLGFEPQVMKIIDNVRPDRQTVLFSATFPRQMEALARKILDKPVEVLVGGRSVVAKDISQHVVICETEEKFLRLLELLGLYQEDGSVLVFVDKQEHADELMNNLCKHSYPCMALHGGIDQYDRDSTILDFKNGNIKLLVATSVAARGLDVKHLILVVNYDCPNHYEDYVHRCGRTGRAGSKGVAYTLITPEQKRQAGDVMKAFELSNTSIPDDLKALWAKYVEEMKAEGKTVKAGGGGFGGRGFKFDETEANIANDRKKVQAAALGITNDGEDVPADIDEQIETLFASKKRVTDVAKANMPMVGAGVATPSQSQNLKALEEARLRASTVHRARNIGAEATDITQQAAVALLRGGAIQAPQVSTRTIANQMAEKLNAKLGYTAKIEEVEEVVETVTRYEEELEINDFPQTCRWRVTSRDALANISEFAEAGVTVRGTYVLPNKEPPAGEQKLYLAIEATSELAVQKAKAEITRLIKEELVRLQNSYQPINKSRYKVV
ncbi:probable ATP-dependent RNA helicase DDX46 [Watersipora subatra]|uniref:probable ATP-dependent RNA helicase DDX46 n=1 Tax=Watersipora subatra TaxID=2589382 RepID=UPI00355C74C7